MRNTQGYRKNIEFVMEHNDTQGTAKRLCVDHRGLGAVGMCLFTRSSSISVILCEAPHLDTGLTVKLCFCWIPLTWCP